MFVLQAPESLRWASDLTFAIVRIKATI